MLTAGRPCLIVSQARKHRWSRRRF